MLLCQNGNGIGSDFIGKIAVGGDAVGAQNDAINPPLLHQETGGVIANKSDLNSFLHQFPTSQSRPLQERTGFIGEDLNSLSGVAGGIYDGQRCAASSGSEGAGVAVGQDGIAVFQERLSVDANGAAHGFIFRKNQACLIPENSAILVNIIRGILIGFIEGALHRPSQIDRSRPG